MSSNIFNTQWAIHLGYHFERIAFLHMVNLVKLTSQAEMDLLKNVSKIA